MGEIKMSNTDDLEVNLTPLTICEGECEGDDKSYIFKYVGEKMVNGKKVYIDDNGYEFSTCKPLKFKEANAIFYCKKDEKGNPVLDRGLVLENVLNLMEKYWI